MNAAPLGAKTRRIAAFGGRSAPAYYCSGDQNVTCAL